MHANFLLGAYINTKNMIGANQQFRIDLIARLESMPFEEAREKILKFQLGFQPESEGHNICLSWLQGKEYELRDLREEESLSNSRKALEISERANEFAKRAALSSERATRIATSAIVLSIIMAIYEIMKFYHVV